MAESTKSETANADQDAAREAERVAREQAEAEKSTAEQAKDAAREAERVAEEQRAAEAQAEKDANPEEVVGIVETPVAVELDPDYELPEGEDTVSVEVGSYEPLELTVGKSVEIHPEHARLLDPVPAVRRAE